MLENCLLRIVVIMIAGGIAVFPASAGNLKITLPKRSMLTPVQRLNREGVEAIRKRQFEKAETLFYKAYLYDPDDPFTLYDLGYVSELHGQLDRAQRFYSLAAEQASNAVIARADSRQLEGKRMKDVVGSLRNAAMQINGQNVEAIRLLAEGRAIEAESLLQKTLVLDPHNPFTLNNLGVAKEGQGELEAALKYYTAAAASHSSEPAMVTLNDAYRGKPLSEVAADSAKKVRERLQTEQTSTARAAGLTLRGVSALNRNDWHNASQDFLQAYSLDPNNAFTINNLGYVAEMDGDLETASFFYEKAQKGEGANEHVGLASRRSADGMRLFAVADQSDQKVDAKMEAETAKRRQQGGAIQLRRRDGKPLDAQPDESQPSTGEPTPQSPTVQPPGGPTNPQPNY
jgi:Flp pilus assembly protein TadD